MTDHLGPKKTWLEKFVQINRTRDIQARDVEILKTLYKFRFMSASQIDTLFWNSFQASRRRLKMLYELEILDRFKSSLSSEFFYCIGHVGIYYLAQAMDCTVSEIHWQRRNKVSSLFFLNHYLETVNTYLELRKFNTRNVKVEPNLKHYKPDLYLEISHNGFRYYFFIEVDRATERQQKILAKIKGYERYCAEAKIKPILLFKVPDQERQKQLNKWLNGKYTVGIDIYKVVSNCLGG